MTEVRNPGCWGPAPTGQEQEREEKKEKKR